MLHCNLCLNHKFWVEVRKRKRISTVNEIYAILTYCSRLISDARIPSLLFTMKPSVPLSLEVDFTINSAQPLSACKRSDFATSWAPLSVCNRSDLVPARRFKDKVSSARSVTSPPWSVRTEARRRAGHVVCMLVR